ncbi:MAG: crossover junction endodeoxyribonuclease RuvC [Spirochaetales bacterium]|uniref:Crossover junction endodeoxyribonuclease RuvC n=1 Tax=Candidatus Thalassospirochaeta sargassi TaxID=3119039 RepID=A0AAJ1IB07_9SPIO|nr:crossover junction endodeoxyribonuclease RuvC [Spirochaetales bacterium]
MKKRVLGFDPGLANTGWGVIDADASRFRTVAYGAISTSANLSIGERLNIIFSQATEVIRKFEPDVAGIESLYFAKNVTSAIPVAQARGILLLALYQSGIDAEEYTPGQIKMAITGSGRAEKKQIQEMIRILLGMKEYPKPDHAADALGAAVCCFNSNLQTARGL